MIGNLSVVLPYVPAVIGLAGAIRKKYGTRINGPFPVLFLLLALSAAVLFGLDVLPERESVAGAVLEHARCSLLLALESFGVIFGIDRVSGRDARKSA